MQVTNTTNTVTMESRRQPKWLCFCGAQAHRVLMGTAYRYCESHADTTLRVYARWIQRGGTPQIACV